MRIGIAVEKIKIKKRGTLAIGKVDGRLIYRGGDHTGSKNNHINIQIKIITKQGISGMHNKCVTTLFNTGNRSLGQEHAIFLLHGLVKQLGIAGCTHMLVQDIRLTVVGMILTHVACLFQGDHGGNRVTVGKILVVIFAAWALYKGNSCRDLTFLGKFFKLSIGDHVFQFSITKMLKFGNISRTPAGGKDNRTKHFPIRIQFSVGFQTGIWIFHLTLVNEILFINTNLGRGIPFAFRAGCFYGHIKLTGSATNTGNFTAGFNGYVGIRLNIGNHLGDIWLFQLCIGVLGRKHFPPAESLTAKDTVFFDNGCLVSGLTGLKSCGKSCYTTAHDENIFIDRFEFVGLRQLTFLRTGNGHANIVLTQLLQKLINTFFFTFSVGSPGNLFAQVTAYSHYTFTKGELFLHNPW